MSTNFENGIQITEEQEQLILDTIELYDDKCVVTVDNPIETAVAFSKSLSTEQLKQLCEAKGLSVVEWVDFDSSDESTWPKFGLSYYVDSNEYGYTRAYFKNDGNWVCYGDIITTTVEAYSKLPQRKESK